MWPPPATLAKGKTMGSNQTAADMEFALTVVEAWQTASDDVYDQLAGVKFEVVDRVIFGDTGSLDWAYVAEPLINSELADAQAPFRVVAVNLHSLRLKPADGPDQFPQAEPEARGNAFQMIPLLDDPSGAEVAVPRCRYCGKVWDYQTVHPECLRQHSFEKAAERLMQKARYGNMRFLEDVIETVFSQYDPKFDLTRMQQAGSDELNSLYAAVVEQARLTVEEWFTGEDSAIPARRRPRS